ncbi:DgyrCDS13105 [Dimorphilus gyrociliatus]|uniref:DgyrCDS13105 n=1 Tax=Dimorphilus gyrociliatus TaxID=2664684 RepID=A0A7I8W9N4_9ANNE|nr:DgyrCDS13105 [Dimorphilus gyrociliatus]
MEERRLPSPNSLNSSISSNGAQVGVIRTLSASSPRQHHGKNSHGHVLIRKDTPRVLDLPVKVPSKCKPTCGFRDLYNMHSYKIEKSTVKQKYLTAGTQNATEMLINLAQMNGGYVNIGDIPTEVAEKVFSKHQATKESARTTYDKCVCWLNAISLSP